MQLEAIVSTMILKKLILISLILALLTGVFGQQELYVTANRSEELTEDFQADSVMEFYALWKLIRDSKIDKEQALVKLNSTLKHAETNFYRVKPQKASNKEKWVFPVENYTYKSIGGRNGSGYIVSKFDFFDYSKPGGHPAHDIFIRDKNQDCLDDITLHPVGILSVSSGIVLSVENNWTPDSVWKGGKYIYVYDPNQQSIFYYAHSDTVIVRPGDIVDPGTLLAYIGRTGVNANAQRSTTHLHFAQLLIDQNGYPRPRNPYKDLINAQTIYCTDLKQ